MNEMDYPREDLSSDEEGPDSDVQLLHVASLMASVKSRNLVKMNPALST